MDPKSLSNLDPKLRETYERVMGGSASPATPPAQDAAPMAPVTPSATDPVTPPATSVAPPIPTPSSTPVVDPTLSAPPPTATPFTPSQTPVIPVNEPSPLPSPASVNQGVEGSPASPFVRVAYIIGAIVFFVVYTYFWMRVFNLELPF